GFSLQIVVVGRSKLFFPTTTRDRDERLRFDRRLVDEHHRYVIFDRVYAVTLFTFERCVVLHELDRRLAIRAGQNLEQFGIDRHQRLQLNSWTITFWSKISGMQALRAGCCFVIAGLLVVLAALPVSAQSEIDPY